MPVAGIVPVYVYPTEFGNFVVEVVDDSDQSIAGSYIVLGNRLVWRADAPLDPGATYSMTVSVEGFPSDGGELQFTTSADEGAPAPVLVLVEGSLSEEQYVAISRCCDDGFDTCGARYCEPAAYGYRPQMHLQFEASGLPARYLDLTTASDGPWKTDRQQVVGGELLTTVIFADYADNYCATVTATSLVDGASVSQQHCYDQAELGTIERTAASEGTCDGELVDNEPDDEITPDGGGCSAGSSRSSAPVLASLLAMLIAVARRRRDQAVTRPSGRPAQ